MIECSHIPCKNLADFYVQNKNFSYENWFLCKKHLCEYDLEGYVLTEILRFEVDVEEDENDSN